MDGFGAKPDLLKPETITTMVTPPAAGTYACGWAILTNTRTTTGALNQAVDGLLWPIVNNSATPWQDLDQF